MRRSVRSTLGRPRLALSRLAIAALGLSACAKPTELVTADRLVLVQGDAQVRQAGRRLLIPLVFRAVDGAGIGVPAIPVTLIVEPGGGAVDSASVKTDANGEVRIRWTLGTAPLQQLTATAPGVPVVRATATALQPTDVVIVQGNGQSGRIGAALAHPIVVRVLGAGNVPMDSTPVTLQIASGGGTLAPQSVTTGATGEATVRWTLGPTAGPNTAFVRVGTLDPVVVSATATP